MITRKTAPIVFIAIVLAALLGWVVAVARPQTADVIVPGGPVGGMASLYRDFGAYQAPVVALAPFDSATGASLMIDVAHHETHEGEMFHAEYTNASVSDAASVDVLLRTSTKDSHTVFDVYAGGQTKIYLYEAPTVTAVGTAVPAYNMNRSASLTSTVAISHTPTITVSTTILVNGRVLPGGTSQQTRVGGGVRQGTEWILKPNTNYLIRATNTSGGSVPINVVIEWYEESTGVQ